MKYENNGSKTYLIRGRYDTTYTKTGNEILTYATSQGYNAALLFEYDVNPVAYQILLIGSTGSDLYMYQNNIGSQFGIKNVNYTKHKSNPVWAESSGFTVITGTQTDFSVESILDGYYRILKYQSWTDPYEPVFISTLSFNKIYLNNQDVTPVTYNWHSLTSISGNGLTVPLVKLASDAINNGDPVSDATTSAFDVLPSSDNNVRSLVNLTLEPISTGNAVTITYIIPTLKDDSYSSVKIYAKIGEVPKCDETDDIIEDVDPAINEISLENLEFETEYFFCIQSISNNGLKLSSNVESITTGELEGTTFDFTGNEQIFVVPETGKYLLETWGAQGQNDGSTRGGYGAYARGEVWLTQGQTLYIGVGGQNGYNGGGNYTTGTIRNIGMSNFTQALVFDDSLWTNDYNSGNVTVGSKPTVFTLGYDFLDLVMNATIGTQSVLIYENNGVQVYGMRDNTNATYGGYYKYSVYIKDGNEIVAGSQYPTAYYSQAWYVASGFDKRDSYYNSNVWDRIQALYIGFGVDDNAQLGYLFGGAKWHEGYYQGSYINYDGYTGKKISNNTGTVGTYCNQAKLYNALKKMAGEI